MAIRVDSSLFENEHGRKPCGYGMWSFSYESWLVNRYGPDIRDSHTIFITDDYRSAVAEAKRQMRRDHQIQDGTLKVHP